MKSMLMSAVALSAFALSAPVMAEPVRAIAGDYVQFSLGSAVAGQTKLSLSGIGSGDEDLEAGLFAAVAGGRSLDSGLAFEVEAIYLQNDIDTDDLDAIIGAPLDASARTYGLMLNAHYAAVPVGPFTAEVGGGVGYGQTKYKLLGVSDDADGLMWQLIAGLSYPVSEKFSWDLKYRYLRGPNMRTDVGTISAELKTSAHVVAFGGRVKF